MNDFLNQVIWDNSIRDYLIVASSILLIFIIKRYLSKYFAGLLFKLVQLVFRGVDKRPFVNLIVRPLEIFLVILVTMIALEKLSFPTALKFDIYKTSLHSIVETTSKIILLLVFTWLLLRVIDFTALVFEKRANLTPDQTDNQLVSFFKDFFKAIIAIVGFIMILKFAFNFQVSSLLTGLSIATAAIALATRESLENLIASFIIFFDKPFTTGDLVRVQQITGIVEKIGLRSTRIRTNEKTYVTVPNKQMVDSILDNLSLRSHRRALVNLELDSQTPAKEVSGILPAISGLLNGNGQVDTSTVLLTDVNKDAFVIQVEYFVLAGTQEAFNKVRQEINLSIVGLIEKMGIKLASRNIEVTLKKENELSK
jgi:MscS family membrane protein